MDQISTLTLSDVQRLLDEVIAERGADYIDRNAKLGKGCRYRTYGDDWSEPAPDCGVGCVLFKHGYTLSDLQMLDSYNFGSGAPAHDIYQVLPDALTTDAAQYLQDFQYKQDFGQTWGAAREYAEKELAYRLAAEQEAAQEKAAPNE